MKEPIGIITEPTGENKFLPYSTLPTWCLEEIASGRAGKVPGYGDLAGEDDAFEAAYAAILLKERGL